MSLLIVLKNGEGQEIASCEAVHSAQMAIERAYLPGDCFEVSGADHLMVQMDQCLTQGEIYTPSGCFTYRIPFGSERTAYPPFAFEGERHIIRVREMEKEERMAERAISSNPHDLRGNTDFYPHATANVETRGEADFAARNVIDGLSVNHSHGSWPYGSWGIGTKQDAALTIDFGRPVRASRVRVLLRADFPHDSWWESCDLVFSDGSKEHMHLEKTDTFQDIPVDKTISWIRMENLRKADDPSPFPSLRQLEVIGRDIL